MINELKRDNNVMLFVVDDLCGGELLVDYLIPYIYPMQVNTAIFDTGKEVLQYARDLADEYCMELYIETYSGEAL